MTKRFILLSVILAFIVAPLSAWLIVSTNYSRDPVSKKPDQSVTPATKEELFEAITTTTKHEHVHQFEEEDGEIYTIVSHEQINTWWYIINVTYEDPIENEKRTAPMLAVKYYNGTDSIRVVTHPNEPLPFYNISDSIGVPYEVIDKYSAAIAEAQPTIEEEEDY